MPLDIIDAANAVFGKTNAYVVLGDLANKLFADIDLANIYPEGVPKEFPYLQSLVLVFEYGEKITDNQAAEATRLRTDWKYALHRPFTAPGLNANAFCDFRHRLFTQAEYKAQFQRVLDRFRENATVPRALVPDVDAEGVLQSVCARNRLARVVTTMQAVVHLMVATERNLLRRIMRPHWLLRYSRTLTTVQLPDDLESQISLAESVGEDGLYLMQALAHADTARLTEQAELQTLRQIWEIEFEQRDGHCKWRQTRCARCDLKTGVPDDPRLLQEAN